MPIYEYRCLNCKRRFSLLRSFSDESAPQCPRCESREVKRLISRVAVLRSEESRLESLADPSHFADVDENDPRSMARSMRRMGQEMGGEELGPEFDEMVDRLEAGENPEEIESSLGEGESSALGEE
ncbi:MAG: zinc ribbon domain-containing protein [Chloroflexi bacterium]|nr:zinc ribbon domain-containing protein [Chloroflexota bacterium]